MSIKKISEKLRNGEELTENEKVEFDNFREAHNIIMKLFTDELKKINCKLPLIFSRNKRIESIITKLRRPEKPKLNSINDISGIRIVFDNLEKLYKFIKIINKTNLNNFKEKININKDKYNYIKNPKPDGYRSIHKIFYYDSQEEYTTDNKIFNLENRKIELQLRTTLQHIWATTLEIYDIVNNTTLKTDTNDKLKTTAGLFFKNVV